MKKLIFLLVFWFSLSGAALAVVNINTASKEELTTLKGVGDKRAQDIIDYRKKHGNFKSVDELEKVPGIGPGLMKQIRAELTVTGKTSIDKAKTAPSAAAPKGDAMKSPTATAKTAEKAKADEKKAAK